MNSKLKEFIDEYSSTNGSPYILDKFTKSFTSIIVSFVPRKCQTEESLNQFRKIFIDICKSNENFDTNRFKAMLESTVDIIGTSNTTQTEADIEDLSIMILSASDELDKILNRIDDNIRENLIKSMKELVVTELKSTKFTFKSIMKQIDDKIEKLYNLQSIDKDSKIVSDKFIIDLTSKYTPNKIFTIDIKQIIGNREDSDLFEFIPIDKLNPDNFNVSQSDERIDVSPFSISGITPTQDVERLYSLTLVHTYLKDGGKINSSIKVTIVFCNQSNQLKQVSNLQENKKESNNSIIALTFLIFGIIVLVIIIAIFVRYKFKQNNVLDQIDEDFEINDIANASYVHSEIYPKIIFS